MEQSNVLTTPGGIKKFRPVVRKLLNDNVYEEKCTKCPQAGHTAVDCPAKCYLCEEKHSTLSCPEWDKDPGSYKYGEEDALKQLSKQINNLGIISLEEVKQLADGVESIIHLVDDSLKAKQSVRKALKNVFDMARKQRLTLALKKVDDAKANLIKYGMLTTQKESSIPLKPENLDEFVLRYKDEKEYMDKQQDKVVPSNYSEAFLAAMKIEGLSWSTSETVKAEFQKRYIEVMNRLKKEIDDNISEAEKVKKLQLFNN